ncbi:MAG: hypothetical protein M9922_08270 [Microthrixaceae bacterium]|nr:hypothetical protein [Microthrixaceae bacterium]
MRIRSTITRQVVTTFGVASSLTLLTGLTPGTAVLTAAQEGEGSGATTALVERRDLAETLTIDGIYELGEHLSVVSSSSGTVVQLPEPGETLQRGEVLFAVSSDPTAVETASAVSQVASAEAQRATSANQLSETTKGASTAQVASSTASVITAQRRLDDLLAPPTEAQIATVDAQVAVAEQNLENVSEGASESDIARAESQVAQAESQLVNSQNAQNNAWLTLLSAHTNYCNLASPPVDVCGPGRPPLSPSEMTALNQALQEAIVAGDPDTIVPFTQALVSAQENYDDAIGRVESAQSGVESAESAHDQLLEPPDAAALATVEAQYATAVQQREDLLAGALPLAIAEARANLTAAEAALDDLLAGATAETVAAARAALDSGDANVVVALAQLEELRRTATAPVLMYGTSPMTRDLRPGDEGDDVAQLQANLMALGFDADGALAVNGVYDGATAVAVERWRGELGAEDADFVPRGSIVFLDGPVVVDSIASGAQVGLGVAAGSPLVQVTTTAELVERAPDPDSSLRSTQRVVAHLPQADRPLLSVGDEVTIQLPDLTEVPGTVTRIAAGASSGGLTAVPQSDLSASAGAMGSSGAAAATTSAGSEPSGESDFFEVLVDPAEAVDDIWVGSDVEVRVASELAEDVLTVPVSALVVPVDGGYAVEVVQDDGTTRLTAVDAGSFNDGFVEIIGDIDEGSEVVTAP